MGRLLEEGRVSCRKVAKLLLLKYICDNTEQGTRLAPEKLGRPDRGSPNERAVSPARGVCAPPTATAICAPQNAMALPL